MKQMSRSPSLQRVINECTEGQAEKTIQVKNTECFFKKKNIVYLPRLGEIIKYEPSLDD